MFARATALSLKDSLEFTPGAISPMGYTEISQDTKTHILELANTLQDILGEAMDTAKAMFPTKRHPRLPGERFLATSGLTRCGTMSLRYAVGQRLSGDSSGSKPARPGPQRTNRSFWIPTQLSGAASTRLYNCVRLSHPYLGASTLSAFSHERISNQMVKPSPLRQYNPASKA
jgi:hypothetical protein